VLFSPSGMIFTPCQYFGRFYLAILGTFCQ
jgi:hypothetical protein